MTLFCGYGYYGIFVTSLINIVRLKKVKIYPKNFMAKNIVEGVEYEVEETDDEKDSGDDN